MTSNNSPFCYKRGELGLDQAIVGLKIETEFDTERKLQYFHNFLTKTYVPGHWTTSYQGNTLTLQTMRCLCRATLSLLLSEGR
jgi:hypothetical protein